MKRFKFLLNSFAGKIILLFSTFCIGTASTWLSFEVSSPTVSLCQLAQNPEWYDGKTIRVEADGRSFYGGVHIFDQSCNSSKAGAGIWLVEGYKPFGNAEKFYAESKVEVLKVRIVVVGRYDAHAKMGCFGPKAAIHATSVELKSEIETEPLKKHTEE